MITNVLFSLGALIISVGIILFYKKKQLYKNGIRTIGKVVEIETYTYLTPGPEFNTLYYSGVTPIIEVDDNGKKVRVAYIAIDDYPNLSKGDEVEVIYPKGKIEELTVCKEKELYKLPLTICIIGILITILAVSINLI